MQFPPVRCHLLRPCLLQNRPVHPSVPRRLGLRNLQLWIGVPAQIGMGRSRREIHHLRRNRLRHRHHRARFRPFHCVCPCGRESGRPTTSRLLHFVHSLHRLKTGLRKDLQFPVRWCHAVGLLLVGLRAGGISLRLLPVRISPPPPVVSFVFVELYFPLI